MFNKSKYNWFSRRTKLLVMGSFCLLGALIGAWLGHPQTSQDETINLRSVMVTKRDLPLFHTVAMSRTDSSKHAVEVTIRAGDRQSVAIVSDYGGQEAVRTSVLDGVLHVVLNQKTGSEGTLRINLASPRLRKISMDGAGIIRINGGLRAATIHLEASSGAHITAHRLGTRQLNVAVRRGGRIDVGGTTSLLRAQASSGTIHAGTLETDVAHVSSVERSQVEIRARQRLEAFGRRQGQILLQGDSQRVLRDLDTSSSLKLL